MTDFDNTRDITDAEEAYWQAEVRTMVGSDYHIKQQFIAAGREDLIGDPLGEYLFLKGELS